MSDDGEVKGDRESVSPVRSKPEWIDQMPRRRRPGPVFGDNGFAAGGESTRAVHAGTVNDPVTGAVGTPIYQASTFILNGEQYRSVEEGYARDRFIYTRYGNPSQWAVQNKLASLEGSESALVFSSGMAAITASLLSLMDKGAHVVASNELYGGTYNLLNQELPSLGMSASYADPRNLAAIEAAVRPETQVLYFEIMTNPLLKLVDLEGLVSLARRHNLRVIIDATFATPLACRPLEYGVDVVVHSATKYLNGHSDLVAGAALGSRKLVDMIWSRLLSYGGCLDPHGCFLLERSLKTLPARMRAHAETAMEVAHYLERHPAVARVLYPLLPSHPDHELARRQLRIGTGMVTFDVAGGDPAALALLDTLELPRQATSLGGVETLVSLPFNTSHAGYTSAQRAALGINPGCVRMSVGIEDAEDLIADLAQGLDGISSFQQEAVSHA